MAKKQSRSLAKTEKEVRFVAMGEREVETVLTLGLVTHYLVKPTRSGKLPSMEEVSCFIKLCQHNELNPWVGDAFMVGYEDASGKASWSLITANQAYFKRANTNPAYHGCESGVIVRTGEGLVEEREGCLLFQGEQLLGGFRIATGGTIQELIRVEMWVSH